MKLLTPRDRPANGLILPRRPIPATPQEYGRIRRMSEFKPGEKIAHGTKIWNGAGDRAYTFDANMGLSDGAAAITAAGWAQYGGAQGIVDLGGNQGITITLPSIAATSTLTPQQDRIDAMCVIYVGGITISGSDVYKMFLAGSNNPAVNSSNVILGALEFGIGAQMDVPNCANTAALTTYPAGNMYELPFTNEQNSTKYEFVSMYVTGTFGSITFTAFVAVLPVE